MDGLPTWAVVAWAMAVVVTLLHIGAKLDEIAKIMRSREN